MHMQVMHLLPAFTARVHHDAKTAIRVRVATLLQRQLRCQNHDLAQECFIRLRNVRHRNNVLFRHDQKVHRGSRIDVVKGKKFIIFIHLAARNLACGDFAEDSVGIVRGVYVLCHGQVQIKKREGDRGSKLER